MRTVVLWLAGGKPRYHYSPGVSSSFTPWLAGASCDTTFLRSKEKLSPDPWRRHLSSDRELAAAQLPSHWFYQYSSCLLSFFPSPGQLPENQRTVPNNRLERSWLCTPPRYIFPPQRHGLWCSVDVCGNMCGLFSWCLRGAEDRWPCLLLTRVSGMIILEQ